MINIFENDTIYGSAYEKVGEPRLLNSVELSKLNINCPAVVAQGKYGLYCKMYVNGSTTTFYCKGLDTHSVAVEGQVFDVKKCLVTMWRKPSTNEMKIKILVTREALV